MDWLKIVMIYYLCYVVCMSAMLGEEKNLVHCFVKGMKLFLFASIVISVLLVLL